MNLLAYLAIPSLLSVCFLIAAHTLQTLNMRLGETEPLPDRAWPEPEQLQLAWRRSRAKIRPTQRAMGIAHLRLRERLQPQLSSARLLAPPKRFARPLLAAPVSVSFEAMHRALVLPGLLERLKRAQIPVFAGSLPLLA